MILQYSLSIYAINFFTFPTFANFKVRLINQQNGDCNDSIILNTQLINSSTFPVHIKLKGSQRLLVKVKIIAYKTKQAEIMIGQGLVNIDNNIIQNSVRVPIYDKTKGIEEIAICSVDFFVSGNPISKNISVGLNKSKSKIEVKRDNSQDAVYSQMSYTVQSENQQIELQTAPTNTIQKSNKIIENTNRNYNSIESQYANSRRVPSMQKESLSNQKDSRKRVEYSVQPPLQNIAYLSQSLSPRKKYSSQKEQPQTEDKRMNQQEDSLIEEKRGQKQTLDAQNLKRKIQQQQEITKQLKRYLAKHTQKQRTYSTQIKTQKHKVRRKELKVKQISSFKPQLKYLKYFIQLNQKCGFFISNLKAQKITQNDVKENNYSFGVQIVINKLSLSIANNQEIVSFDVLGYRAYCIANYINEYPISIMIPLIQQGLKINVQLNNIGTFQGTIGEQEGEKISVILKPKDKERHNIVSTLKKQIYKLTFDIKRNGSSLDVQDTIKYQKNDISYRQPTQMSSTQANIRDRIHSFSIQPWGYGYSYLNQKNNQQKDIISKIQQKRLSIQTEAKHKMEGSKIEVTDKEVNKKQVVKAIPQLRKQKYLQPQSQEEPKNTQIMAVQSHKKQKKRMKSEPRSSQYQSMEENKAKKEKNQIMNIRNGNRNNYKFKKQNEQKKPNLKQMWEKLLIKKKVQQQASSDKSKHKFTPKKSPISTFIHQQRENQSSINQSNKTSTFKSNLYTVSPDSNRVLAASKANRASQHDQLVPFRTITVQIKNISITQPLAIVAQQLGEMSGKFIKLQIKDKIVYYTEIIFNGEFNSILWKLSGCVFNQLAGHQHLEIQINKTAQNKIVRLGRTSIRVSKLHFLRNNHIYNGKIMYNQILNGEFTIGFEVHQNLPFEVIQEQNDQIENHSLLLPNTIDKNIRIRQRDESLGSIASSKANKNADRSISESFLLRKTNRMQLIDTLKRDQNINKKRNRLFNDTPQIGLSELQQSNLMPQGLTLTQQIRQR